MLRICLWLLGSSLAFAVAVSAAPTPTAEQLEAFQKLTPEQQRLVMERMQGAGAVTTPTGPGDAATSSGPAAGIEPRAAATARDSWREFDLRRLALEHPELEACLRRYDDEDLRAVRAAASRVGNDAFTTGRLPWSVRRRLGFLGEDIDFHKALPGIAEPEAIQTRLRERERWLDVWRCIDLLGQYEREGGRLRPYGYDVFAGTPDSFAPATDIPVPADYVIGPGDSVDVQLFGKENAQHRLVVTRDGLLNFPGIGPIPVVGLKFDQLSRTLEQRVAQQMIGVRASVTLGPLRSMQVFVLGDAHRPGAYTVSSLATVTHALVASGGVEPTGSLRRIELKRQGKIARTLDLYDLLLRGDNGDDVRLQPGDVVFVPPVGATVAVSGEVRRPAIYEVEPGETAAAAVALAGGLLPTAYPQATRLERIGSERTREIVDLDLTADAGRNAKLATGDYLRVYSMLERMESFVRLDGHVLRPGVYEWREGLRLSDVLKGVEELQPRPDLDYVLIRREVGPERKVAAFSASLARAWAARGSESDPPIEARDRVYVFGLEGDRQPLVTPVVQELTLQARTGEPAPRVNVSGWVRSPGTYPLEAGMTVGDLLRAAGGLREEAYDVEAEITRYGVDDAVVRFAHHLKVDLAAVLRGEAGADFALAPYDVLNVKPIPQWRESETVELLGEVRFPGTYAVKRGETLREVIERAGGLTEDAFVGGAVFTRIELRRREQEQMDRLAKRLETELAALALQRSNADPRAQDALAVGQAVVQEVKGMQAVGRLVIDLPAVMTSELPLELRAGDRLFVPRRSQEVTVIGEVQYQTSHLYRESHDLGDYIAKSGGLTQRGDDDAIYVVRANGVVNVGSAAKRIKPGDTVVVPLDTERMQPLVFWSTVSQILYQFALTAASAKTLGVF